jgi:transcriptional regulator with GAF, ATPase, and Fis domain
MVDIHRLAARVAAGSISVLLLGETGTGKGVLARQLHELSPRREQRFLRLDCAALAETLLASELFGHEKGAFTGAVAAKPGLLEAASGGSVFLDEVGELPASIQVRLLGVLEAREVLRVGGLAPRPVDVRFIAATNRDLAADVAAGRFRQDLYYRLAGATLILPPLRDRPAEIEALARAFLGEAAAAMAAPPALSPEALRALVDRSWPGNVRELRNVVERAVLLAGAGPITTEHLPMDRLRAGASPAAAPPAPAPVPAPSAAPAPASGDPDRRRILDALAACAGNQTRAARMLGMSRGTLIARLSAYGIARPRRRT